MPKSTGVLTDQKVDRIIGNLLRIGVLIAATVVLGGGVLYLIRYGAGLPDYKVFRGEPADLTGVVGIINDVLSLRRRALIQLGLLLLIATPVARVICAVVGFALQRDFTYVVVSLIVLTMLIYSLLGGVL